VAVVSMTGFARGEGQLDGCRWSWEVRSVNARGLETRVRIPSGFEGLDPQVRERVARALKRGSVMATLNVTGQAGQTGVRVNMAVLDAILAIVPDIQRRLSDAPPPTVEGLLALKGVIEPEDALMSADARSAFEGALLARLDEVLQRLTVNRRAEGARLAQVLADQVQRIGELSRQAGTLAATQTEAILRRLKEQVEQLVSQIPSMPEERLVQEAALLAVKADPREELDRLTSHCAAAVALLAKGSPIGRQFDFLCQEMNREANTLCAKAGDVDLTRIGLDLRATVDQLREQVQNIE
jgi:uncharacterized protein (TIGR00255 family)